jgi:D-serine deaminase-like pyridoxal phosphate-dependent protein
MEVPEKITDLSTPCLLLDKEKLQSNIQKMSKHILGLNGKLRPHVKTHKSLHITNMLMEDSSTAGITVSTLHEADYFFRNGITDILYAVGIAPNKLPHIHTLIEDGCDIKIILDNLDAARRVVEFSEHKKCVFKVLIELDTDGHRSGVQPNSSDMLEIGTLLNSGHYTELSGVMTHAGESYQCETPEDLLKIAQQERNLTVASAQMLKDHGLPCPIVSVGSTPTALTIDDLTGVTEVRAGVYTFFDLVMSGLGVCDTEDIAISVLSSVIGFQQDKNWIITDSGWMALSADKGTSEQKIDYGYGMVSLVDNKPIESFIVSSANQEHGIIQHRDPQHPSIPDAFNIGSIVNILPIHACSTASQYNYYWLVDGDNVIAQWPRINGW